VVEGSGEVMSFEKGSKNLKTGKPCLFRWEALKCNSPIFLK